MFMKNRRFLFSFIIKLMMYSGLLLLTIVFLNSLFVDNNSKSKTTNVEIPSVMINTTEMKLGEIRKVRWDNKEIAILHRQFPERLLQRTLDSSETLVHYSVEQQTRWKKIEYFVYFNVGDSKNCPLYYAGGEFKDVCSSNRFDEAGRNLNTNIKSYMLQIPPHYFVQDKLILGKWQP